jgi:hypothetical protein
MLWGAMFGGVANKNAGSFRMMARDGQRQKRDAKCAKGAKFREENAGD